MNWSLRGGFDAVTIEDLRFRMSPTPPRYFAWKKLTALAAGNSNLEPGRKPRQQGFATRTERPLGYLCVNL
jgi:hypothetical protein